MNESVLFIAGVAVGLLAARFLIAPDDCCVRVAAGVRERVGTELGSTAQAIGDVLGVWPYAPGVLKTLGVPA